jgi:hypothetical protein
MSKVDNAETNLLNTVLAAKTWTNVAVASTASTTIWVSLHTADPGDTGDQSTNETTYTGYLRVATARTTAGWVVSSGSASPAAAITFATCTASSTTVITHFSVGLSSSGAGTALYNGTVTPNISITTNVTASLTTASAITED